MEEKKTSPKLTPPVQVLKQVPPPPKPPPVVPPAGKTPPLPPVTEPVQVEEPAPLQQNNTLKLMAIAVVVSVLLFAGLILINSKWWANLTAGVGNISTTTTAPVNGAVNPSSQFERARVVDILARFESVDPTPTNKRGLGVVLDAKGNYVLTCIHMLRYKETEPDSILVQNSVARVLSYASEFGVINKNFASIEPPLDFDFANDLAVLYIENPSNSMKGVDATFSKTLSQSLPLAIPANASNMQFFGVEYIREEKGVALILSSFDERMSGSPVFNGKGEIVGIFNSIYRVEDAPVNPNPKDTREYGTMIPATTIEKALQKARLL